MSFELKQDTGILLLHIFSLDNEVIIKKAEFHFSTGILKDFYKISKQFYEKRDLIKEEDEGIKLGKLAVSIAKYFKEDLPEKAFDILKNILEFNTGGNPTPKIFKYTDIPYAVRTGIILPYKINTIHVRYLKRKSYSLENGYHISAVNLHKEILMYIHGRFKEDRFRKIWKVKTVLKFMSEDINMDFVSLFKKIALKGVKYVDIVKFTIGKDLYNVLEDVEQLKLIGCKSNEGFVKDFAKFKNLKDFTINTLRNYTQNMYFKDIPKTLTKINFTAFHGVRFPVKNLKEIKVKYINTIDIIYERDMLPLKIISLSLWNVKNVKLNGVPTDIKGSVFNNLEHLSISCNKTSHHKILEGNFPNLKVIYFGKFGKFVKPINFTAYNLEEINIRFEHVIFIHPKKLRKMTLYIDDGSSNVLEIDDKFENLKEFRIFDESKKEKLPIKLVHEDGNKIKLENFSYTFKYFYPSLNSKNYGFLKEYIDFFETVNLSINIVANHKKINILDFVGYNTIESIRINTVGIGNINIENCKKLENVDINFDVQFNKHFYEKIKGVVNVKDCPKLKGIKHTFKSVIEYKSLREVREDKIMCPKLNIERCGKLKTLETYGNFMQNLYPSLEFLKVSNPLFEQTNSFQKNQNYVKLTIPDNLNYLYFDQLGDPVDHVKWLSEVENNVFNMYGGKGLQKIEFKTIRGKKSRSVNTVVFVDEFPSLRKIRHNIDFFIVYNHNPNTIFEIINPEN